MLGFRLTGHAACSYMAMRAGTWFASWSGQTLCRRLCRSDRCRSPLRCSMRAGRATSLGLMKRRRNGIQLPAANGDRCLVSCPTSALRGFDGQLPLDLSQTRPLTLPSWPHLGGSLLCASKNVLCFFPGTSMAAAPSSPGISGRPSLRLLTLLRYQSSRQLLGVGWPQSCMPFSHQPLDGSPCWCTLPG